MANYSVQPNGDGNWEVKKEKGERASGVFDTKKEALERGRELTLNSGGGELRIKGEDGKIQNTNTLGKKDPNPPRDTKH